MRRIRRATIYPASADISHLRWPDAAPGLRLDTGVDAGDEVIEPTTIPCSARSSPGANRAPGRHRLLRSALE